MKKILRYSVHLIIWLIYAVSIMTLAKHLDHYTAVLAFTGGYFGQSFLRMLDRMFLEKKS